MVPFDVLRLHIGLGFGLAISKEKWLRASRDGIPYLQPFLLLSRPHNNTTPLNTLHNLFFRFSSLEKGVGSPPLTLFESGTSRA